MPTLEISIGELVDKYSILEIKKEKIKDTTKLTAINKELIALSKAEEYIKIWPFFYKLLKFINTEIWDMTDKIKNMSELNTAFAVLANEIFEHNQKRFRLKTYFNVLCGSNLVEKKSYSKNIVTIEVDRLEDMIFKIEEINYLCIQYDNVYFKSNHQSIIKNIFKNPNIIYVEPEGNVPTYSLKDIVVQKNRKIYAFDQYITYRCDGLLGDFIHSLSVVYEKFLLTGKKGIVYIDDKVENFSCGKVNTYNEMKELILNQPYIKDFKLLNNEHYEIDLNAWRNSNKLYKTNFYNIYKEVYDVEWGSKQWIFYHRDFKCEKKEEVLLNTIDRRFPCIDFNKITQTKYKLIYVGFKRNEYNVFVQRTNKNIPFHHVTNIYELCENLLSCKLFIGSLSMPLALAHALNIKRVICYYDVWRIENGERICEDVHMYNMDKIWPNVISYENIDSILE